jgi:hypothetical protein
VKDVVAGSHGCRIGSEWLQLDPPNRVTT